MSAVLLCLTLLSGCAPAAPLASNSPPAEAPPSSPTRADLCEIPAGVSGEIATSFASEIAMFGPALLKSSSP